VYNLNRQLRVGALAGLALVSLLLGAPIAAAGADDLIPPGGARRVVLFEGYELAAALHPWDRVAGLSRYAYDNDLLQRLVPHLRQIPSPGSGFDVNIEGLLTIKPDLVITWSRKPETVDYLKRRGLPVLTIYPEGMEDLARDLVLLGRVFDREERARRVAAAMAGSLAELRRRLSGVPPGSRPRALWTWGKPTIVSGNKGVVPEMMETAGGRNLGAHLEDFNRELSMETIVSQAPEVVFIWGSASYGVDTLLHDPKWQATPAVKNRRIFKATRASTWSPRVVALAWWMAGCLHPQHISEADVQEATERIYRECFGIPFTSLP